MKTFERLFRLYKIKYEIHILGNKHIVKAYLFGLTFYSEFQTNVQYIGKEDEYLLAEIYRIIKRFQKKEFIKTLPKITQKLIQFY